MWGAVRSPEAARMLDHDASAVLHMSPSRRDHRDRVSVLRVAARNRRPSRAALPWSTRPRRDLRGCRRARASGLWRSLAPLSNPADGPRNGGDDRTGDRSRVATRRITSGWCLRDPLRRGISQSPVEPGARCNLDGDGSNGNVQVGRCATRGLPMRPLRSRAPAEDHRACWRGRRCRADPGQALTCARASHGQTVRCSAGPAPDRLNPSPHHHGSGCVAGWKSGAAEFIPTDVLERADEPEARERFCHPLMAP